VKKRLFASPSVDDLILLLQAWRFWLLSGLVGALIGGLVYAVFPPEYRARATVVVDFNMEQAWPVDSDRELFYYLEREARKLEEVAWSDAVLEDVAKNSGGITVGELHSGVLKLSEPADGGWHFYADDPSAERAELLASLWAHAFTVQTQQAVNNAVALDAARKALESNPGDENLLQQVSELESSVLGITPEIQVSLAQTKNLKAVRQAGAGYYMFIGAVVFMALSALGVLLFGKISRA
jgi:hypothetical protein